MRAAGTAALLALLTAVAGCGTEGGGVPGRVQVGAPAPEYAAASLEGDSVSLAELRGRPVLLNVWATWCHPCRTEIPELQALHERYSGQGLEVVGVSVDARGDAAAVRDFAREYGVTYPIWHDPDERVSSTFRILGVPSTYLIDREGTLLWSHVGPVTADDPALTQALAEAMR